MTDKHNKEFERQQKIKLFKMFGFDYDDPEYFDAAQLKRGYLITLSALDSLKAPKKRKK